MSFRKVLPIANIVARSLFVWLRDTCGSTRRVSSTSRAGSGRSNCQIKTLTVAASNAGRPILAGVQVFVSWFREPSSKTGVIDAANPGYRQGGILGVIVGWEPGKKEVKVLTPWPT